MSRHLHDLVFRQLVPESIRSDSQIAAAADAISPFLQTIVRAVPNLLIYGRLEEQDPAGMLAPLRRLTEARGGLKNLSTEELSNSLRGSGTWTSATPQKQTRSCAHLF